MSPWNFGEKQVSHDIVVTVQYFICSSDFKNINKIFSHEQKTQQSNVVGVSLSEPGKKHNQNCYKWKYTVVYVDYTDNHMIQR